MTQKTRTGRCGLCGQPLKNLSHSLICHKSRYHVIGLHDDLRDAIAEQIKAAGGYMVKTEQQVSDDIPHAEGGDGAALRSDIRIELRPGARAWMIIKEAPPAVKFKTLPMAKDTVHLDISVAYPTQGITNVHEDPYAATKQREEAKRVKYLKSHPALATSTTVGALPVVFTTFGKPSPTTLVLLKLAVKATEERTGTAFSVLWQRLSDKITNIFAFRTAERMLEIMNS